VVFGLSLLRVCLVAIIIIDYDYWCQPDVSASQIGNVSWTVTDSRSIRLPPRCRNALNACSGHYKLVYCCFIPSLKPPQSLKLPSMPAGAVWIPSEETSFINFLLDNKSEAGDGGNFKTATYQWAVTHIAPLHEKGIVKACQNKWSAVSILVLVVNKISLMIR